MFFSAAIDQLTKYFACEWAKDNIRSNSVAPWYTLTSLEEPVILFQLVLFPVPRTSHFLVMKIG